MTSTPPPNPKQQAVNSKSSNSRPRRVAAPTIEDRESSPKHPKPSTLNPKPYARPMGAPPSTLNPNSYARPRRGGAPTTTNLSWRSFWTAYAAAMKCRTPASHTPWCVSSIVTRSEPPLRHFCFIPLPRMGHDSRRFLVCICSSGDPVNASR